MHGIKVIFASVCFAFAIYLGWFSFMASGWREIYALSIPAIMAAVLILIGGVLLAKRKSPLSRRAKIPIFTVLGFMFVFLVGLDAKIRFERSTLQARAKEFLSRPVPELFKTNSLDLSSVPEGETVLSTSLRLIERYARNVRIYRSSAIWGQFARQPFETAACEEAAQDNAEALKYIKDCKAIIDQEAEMCFWQWIEDRIEMRWTSPEIEEENQVDRLIRKLDGTWTNELGVLTFDPSGRFSTTQTNQHMFYTGTWMFRPKDNTMVVTSMNPEKYEEENIKIISVDKHNLVFSVDGRTNSVRR